MNRTEVNALERNDILPLLTKFIINNDSLEKLQFHLQSFNPLKVLKMNHYEIRHSNILGWLLDPGENHNLGDAPLKKFIIEVLSHEMNSDKAVEQKTNSLALTEADVFLRHLMDAEVYREWNKQKHPTNKKYFIDLVVVSRHHKFAMIIENKVHAGEGKDQLNLYYEMISRYYPDYTILPVFLTLFPDTPPSDDRYFSYSHLDWYLLMSRYLPLQQHNMNNQVYEFIGYYLELLKDLTLPEAKHIELCRDIYKEHKSAIEQILLLDQVEAPADTTSRTVYEIVHKYKAVSKYIKDFGEVDMFDSAMQQFIGQHPNLAYCGNIGKSSFWFYPKAYEEIPNFRQLTHERWTYCPYPVPYIFGKDKNNAMYLKVEVGHCKDSYSDERLNFILHAETKLGISTRRKPKINQIKKESVPVDWSSESSILNRMNQLYEEKFGDFHPKLLDCVATFNW
ncbi:hypothetical protein FE783_28155 [Paenibacillus mesophilus]|uniref:PD-(D/E)XK nuclease family protein n=1 Tax=Paenibacillus mesophilus TaxID=2582849 RepID=UPI00110E68E2|nr:PD-(D/E)XK nuclease family protein [Paenibacillus mesophilus]TMV45805.1 hypothetical protein FE783_28155 [Paenibacillus mesophilus]